MKTIKDKQLLMGADWAGFPLKEAVKAHLENKRFFKEGGGKRRESAKRRGS